MIDINKKLKEKYTQKTSTSIKLKLEITIDEIEDDLLYDYFFKYISIMNDTKYINTSKSNDNGQSIVMARHKGEHLKDIISSILKSPEGFKMIQDIEKSYKEFFIKLEDENYLKQVSEISEKKPKSKEEILIHSNQSTIFDSQNQNDKVDFIEEKPRLNLLKRED